MSSIPCATASTPDFLVLKMMRPPSSSTVAMYSGLAENGTVKYIRIQLEVSYKVPTEYP
jgi:hypothetical protein